MRGDVHFGAGDASPDAIALAAERVAQRGAALRARPAAETLGHLGAVLERFRDPDSGVRRRLEAVLPEATGFTPATLRTGLDLGFAPLTGEALEHVYTAEIGPLSGSTAKAAGAPHTAVALAGSIPMPSVLSILFPLAVGSPVLCKPASRDLATARLTAEALAEVDPLLGECVAVTPFDARNNEASRAFFSAPCVFATGGDETIAAIDGRLRADQRRAFYRHRVSLAVVDLTRVQASEIERLALDIALWDQLGCLSPIVFHLIGGAEAADEVFAAALADELARLEERLPRGAIDEASAARVVNERADAKMRAALGQPVVLHESAGTRWTVVLERSAEVRPAPLHRFVRLVALAGRDELREALAALVPHLAGVALVGFGDERKDIESLCFEHGASRVCEAGQLQTPPIDWRRDNQPLLLGLTALPHAERSPGAGSVA